MKQAYRKNVYYLQGTDHYYHSLETISVEIRTNDKILFKMTIKYFLANKYVNIIDHCKNLKFHYRQIKTSQLRKFVILVFEIS